MTKVLQAMAGADHGGAEAFFERLTLALHRAGQPQHALIRHNPRRARLLEQAGIGVTQLRFGGALDLSTRWGFARTIRREKPQLVLTWMNRASGFCPRSKGGANGFVQVGRLGGYYDLKYYRHCHHLIGNTRDICRWIRDQGWDGDRVHYLPNFVSDTNQPAISRATFSTPQGQPLVLALGRLHKNKAFDVLIHAMARLPGVYLWIAGDGPLRSELERLASHLGVISRVRFLGWRDDTAALYAASDLFVCPSRHEPLGNVVIEAWANSLPVVAAAAQGPTELIQDGVDGLLTPVDNADAMAAAVKSLLADPARAAAVGEAGRARFQTDFTESAVVARYRDFFAQVVG